MSVSKIDEDGDWTFGNQLAGYIRGSEEIKQNLVTRLLSFKEDWFLDVGAEIDWFQLLSNRNTQEATKNQVAITTVNTKGVLSLDKLNIVIDRENRRAVISLSYTDIYQNTQELTTEVT